MIFIRYTVVVLRQRGLLTPIKHGRGFTTGIVGAGVGGIGGKVGSGVGGGTGRGVGGGVGIEPTGYPLLTSRRSQ